MQDLGQHVENAVQSAIRQAYKREKYSGVHAQDALAHRGEYLFCVRECHRRSVEA